ncbi:MAG: hypothetical protein VX589_21150 [Myxococcota bacterium]|nr:hypothetical protein [Myxococcota bacterium]
MTDQHQQDLTTAPSEARIAEIEQRLSELEHKDQARGRSMLLSVFALYAIFASLLILHWAGHFMRHN